MFIIKITRKTSTLFGIISGFNFTVFSAMSSGGSSDESPSRAEYVKQQREKYLSMTLEEKRKEYRSGKYYTLDEITKWSDLAKIKQLKSDEKLYPMKETLNNKLSIFVGDITNLEIDAIVNAANSSLMGGGGVDGAIHRAAGSDLKKECAPLRGCDTGDAKITCGYKLPAKYVIHTVGPIGEQPQALASCYLRSLTLCRENSVRSVAFPCVSTGIYGYPNAAAAKVVLKTVREWLDKEDNADKIDRIIFCLFLDIDQRIYAEEMPKYFPVL